MVQNVKRKLIKEVLNFEGMKSQNDTKRGKSDELTQIVSMRAGFLYDIKYWQSNVIAVPLRSIEKRHFTVC